MNIEYLNLIPGSSLPVIAHLAPFRCVVVVEAEVTKDWQNLVSDWLVDAGCFYMMAWGLECSSWDDAVDWAVIDKYEYGPIPDDKRVSTTWHEDEPLSEVFWYAKHCATRKDGSAYADDQGATLIMHIARTNQEQEMLAAYHEVEANREL